MSWEKNTRKVTPYTPGEQPKVTGRIIKLNTNECPYPPSPEVEKALKALSVDELRLYPAPDAAELTEAIAEFHGTPASRIFVGVGSDDVISVAFQAFFNGSDPLLFPDVTYSFYPVWAELYGIPYETPALDEGFHIIPADYKKKNGGIIFPNPNAPTGLSEELSLIEDIVSANPESVVIIDEAYMDFGGESAAALTEKYDNLLVIRTFSKSRALAGLRVGYALGNERLIAHLNTIKYSINSYTMNLPSIKLGAAAVRDTAYFEEIVGRVIKTRERMKTELKRLGFSFPDSKANFVFASHKSVPAEEIFKYLRENRIFVRYFKLPRIDNSLRITAGTDEEADALIAALEKMPGIGE